MPYINALADLRLPIAFIEYTWFEPMANGVGVKARHFFFFLIMRLTILRRSLLFSKPLLPFLFFFKSLFSLFELSSFPLTLFFFFLYMCICMYISVCVCVCLVCGEREKKKEMVHKKLASERNRTVVFGIRYVAPAISSPCPSPPLPRHLWASVVRTQGTQQSNNNENNSSNIHQKEKKKKLLSSLFFFPLLLPVKKEKEKKKTKQVTQHPVKTRRGWGKRGGGK